MAEMKYRNPVEEQDVAWAIEQLGGYDKSAFRYVTRMMSDYEATEDISRACQIHDTLIGYFTGLKTGLFIGRCDDVAMVMARAVSALVWADDHVQY